MIVLHAILLFLSAVVFFEGVSAYRAATKSSSLCVLLTLRAQRLIGGVIFVSIAFFLLEARWISLDYYKAVGDDDEIAWSLLRFMWLSLLWFSCAFIKHLSSCGDDIFRCPLDRRGHGR